MFEWYTAVIVAVSISGVLLLCFLIGCIVICVCIKKAKPSPNDESIKKKEAPPLKVVKKHPDTYMLPVYSDHFSKSVAFEHASQGKLKRDSEGSIIKVDSSRALALAGPRLSKSKTISVRPSTEGEQNVVIESQPVREYEVIQKKEQVSTLGVDREHPETDIAPAYSNEFLRRIAFEFASERKAREKRYQAFNNRVDHEKMPALAGPRLTRKKKDEVVASVTGNGKQDGGDLTSKLQHRASVESQTKPVIKSETTRPPIDGSKDTKQSEKVETKTATPKKTSTNNESNDDKALPKMRSSPKPRTKQQVSKSTPRQNQNIATTAEMETSAAPTATLLHKNRL